MLTRWLLWCDKSTGTFSNGAFIGLALASSSIRIVTLTGV